MASQNGAKAAIKARFYRFRAALRDKIGGLDGAGFEIDPDALAAAEAALAEMSEEYPDWVEGEIDKLVGHQAMCVENPQSRRECFGKIREIAHDLRGQGATFGYPLITAFADSLYKFARLRGQPTDNHVELIKAHIDGMRAVISNRVSGDGGEIGQALRDGLEKAIAKYGA